MSDEFLGDKRASQLLSRVRDDLSSLRHDVRTLMSHTTRHTLPDEARDLARSGRSHLQSGRAYAVRGAHRVGRTAREHPAGISLGGVLLLGALAVGAYCLLSESCRERRIEALDEDEV